MLVTFQVSGEMFSLAPLATSYCLRLRVLTSYECVYCPSIVRIGRKGIRNNVLCDSWQSLCDCDTRSTLVH